MALPTKKRLPMKQISDYNFLIYGVPKIGKSTFCSRMPEPLFLSTEPGLKALEVYDLPIKSWEQFRLECVDIVTGNHHFKTIVIDTLDNLFKLCNEYVLKKLDITHPGDLPFGKAYVEIKDEFMRVLRKLSMEKYGLVMTSHSALEEVKTRTETIHRAVPTLPRGIRDTIIGWVDVILYAETLPGGERIIHTKPDERWIVGDRTEHAFGRTLPEVLPLNYQEFEISFYGGDLDCSTRKDG